MTTIHLIFFLCNMIGFVFISTVFISTVRPYDFEYMLSLLILN